MDALLRPPLEGIPTPGPKAPAPGVEAKDSPIIQVLHNSDLLTHILLHIRNKTTWKSVFTVEKAWLPAITRYRCKTASWEVITWEADCFWHSCVIDSVRDIIRRKRTRGGDSAKALKPVLFAQAEAAFDTFPALRRVEWTELNWYEHTVKASAVWTVDRADETWKLALHVPNHQDLPLRRSVAEPEHNAHLAMTDRWTVAHTYTLVLSDDSDFVDSFEIPSFDAASQGTLFDVARLSTKGSLGLRTTVLDLGSNACKLSDLAKILARHSEHPTTSQIEGVEGEMINELTPNEFDEFGKTAGAALRHVHLCRCADDDWWEYPFGLTSEFGLNDLHRMIRSVRSHFPVLETLTITLEEDFLRSDETLAMPGEEYVHNPRPLSVIYLQIRGRTAEEHGDPDCEHITPQLPLLGLARNLAFIADRSTKIVLRHWCDHGDYDWSDLSEQAGVLKKIIGFIRSLPDTHIRHLLTVDLDDYDVEPNDYEGFLQLRFRADGKPVPMKVTLAKQRFITVSQAWKDADEPLSIGGEDEIMRSRDVLEESDERVPKLIKHRCESSTSTCEARHEALLDARAEIGRLRRELEEAKKR